MEWMILPFRRYAQFSGRSRRKEYWFYVLFLFLVAIGAAIVDTAFGFGRTFTDVTPTSSFYSWTVSGPVGAIWGLVTLIPTIAVQVRRLHDSDKSGWWLLMFLLPFAGVIVLLVFFCLEGTKGPNRFGPDPLEAASDPRDTYR